MKKKQERMKAILEGKDKDSNNNDNSEIINIEEIEKEEEVMNNNDNFTSNPALLDVINEPNPPNQNNQNDKNQVNISANISNELISEVIIDVMNLNPNLLSGFGNNIEGKWAHGENRGGRPYNPPDGWIGYGLNVLSKYDNGNND